MRRTDLLRNTKGTIGTKRAEEFSFPGVLEACRTRGEYVGLYTCPPTLVSEVFFVGQPILVSRNQFLMTLSSKKRESDGVLAGRTSCIGAISRGGHAALACQHFSSDPTLHAHFRGLAQHACNSIAQVLRFSLRNKVAVTIGMDAGAVEEEVCGVVRDISKEVVTLERLNVEEGVLDGITTIRVSCIASAQYLTAYEILGQVRTLGAERALGVT